MTEQHPTYRPPESFTASFESYVKDEGFSMGNTVSVETVEGYDPTFSGEITDEDTKYADVGEVRHLVEIDTNYKSTRPSEYPVRLTRTEAVALAAALLQATEDTFSYDRGSLRATEAADLLRALAELDYHLAELREDALGDLLADTGVRPRITDPLALGQPSLPADDMTERADETPVSKPIPALAQRSAVEHDTVEQQPVDDSEPPWTLEQQFGDALGAVFPNALHEIASSDAYGALKYKVLQRCQETGETPRQVLNTITPADRAFAPNANDPAAFLASRIEQG